MRNYQLFITILGIFVLVLVGVGFSLAGSPVSQTSIRYDEIRYQNFQDIKFAQEEYFRQNGQLAPALRDLSSSTLRNRESLLDPVTKEEYEYAVTGPYSYSLCTTFATSGEELRQYGTVYSDNPINHNEGRDCVTFEIAAYIRQEVESNPPQEPVASPIELRVPQE